MSGADFRYYSLEFRKSPSLKKLHHLHYLTLRIEETDSRVSLRYLRESELKSLARDSTSVCQFQSSYRYPLRYTHIRSFRVTPGNLISIAFKSTRHFNRDAGIGV